jgi:hypothetical protein
VVQTVEGVQYQVSAAAGLIAVPDLTEYAGKAAAWIVADIMPSASPTMAEHHVFAIATPDSLTQ